MRSPGSPPRPRRFGSAIALVLLAASVASVPGPAAAAPAPYTGVTLRQSSVNVVTDSATDHVRHPQLRIVSPMAPWQAIEPQDDVFDFQQLDLDVQHAAANSYRLLVRIMSGRLSPAWLGDAGVATLQVLGTDDNAHDYCDWIEVPVPWDPDLAVEYREMIAAFGAWAASPDGLGGTNADHLYVIPISMPAILGSEMQVGNGASVTCPAGTDGAGQNLAGVNSAAWNTLGTVAERRGWVAQAWRDAIDIHMDELPPDVRSIIAWGGIFGDGNAAALDLARTEIGPNRQRLWSMYTNLQPLSSGSNQITGVWKDWCPACDQVVMAALEAGGTVGFQVAGTDRMDTAAEFHAAVDDALDRYTPRFIEGSVAAVDREADYLLTSQPSVQDRLAAIAGQVLSTTAVSCTSVAVGDPSTCTAQVTELWDDPDLVAAGEVTWSSAAALGSPTCVLDETGSCSVTVTPGSPGATDVTASYGGDAGHRPSAATGSVETLKRPVSVGASCETPVAARAMSTCTATVTDQGSVTPTGPVVWSLAGAGTLSAGSCSLGGNDATATCAITFSPSTSGASLLTATYAGTATHDGGAATASVDATLRATSVQVSCPAAPVPLGAAGTCTATVADTDGGAGATAPTGTISWDASGGGTFGATTCTLSGAGTSSSCGVAFTPSAEGTATITGSFAGTGVHAAGSASGAVSGVLRTTSVLVTCPTATVPVGTAASCTATVSDTSGASAVAPTGTVTWSTSSVGTFPAGTACALSGTGATRSCQIAYTPSTAGGHVLQAAYSGDALHLGAQASGSLVAAVADTTPPTVSITAPANNANVPKGKNLTITATATDASGVARVEFRVANVLRCTDTSSPYSCVWAVPKPANVTYTIAVTAVDTIGNARTVSITVRAR